MNIRKTAGLLAVAGLVIGLLGTGVGASFFDQVTGTENISVGTFACIIVDPSDGTIAGDQKSVTYTAPQITSSAAGNAPFNFTVKNNGSIGLAITVAKTGQTGNLGGYFSDMPATPSSASLAPGATQLISTGIQWTALDNGALGRSGSMTWTVSCNEAPTVIFNNSDAVLGPNYASYGPEAYSYNEWGGQVAFAGTARKLSNATVTLSSWACQSGGWNTNDCLTTPGATFSVPITFNVYNVDPGNAVGSLIATVTQPFNVPYRPSADGVNCLAVGTDSNGGNDEGKWYNAGDNTCYNGLANNIVFSFAGQSLPNNAIFGVAFNTDNHGYSPLGGSGSPTDSLNIATFPGNGSSTPASVGAWVPNDVSAYLSNDATSSPFAGPVTNMPTGPGDDFVGYMPAVQIVATP